MVDVAHHRDFMCRCSKEGEAECDDVYARALAHMQAGSDNLLGGWVTEKNFVSGAVTFLWWDHKIVIKSIDNDQWSAVSAEMVDYKESKRSTPVTYYIQCDRIEDAFAHLLVDAPKMPEDVHEDKP